MGEGEGGRRVENQFSITIITLYNEQIDVAIEKGIMKVFAQNEQRQRKAKQYLSLYERREKERVGKKC